MSYGKKMCLLTDYDDYNKNKFWSYNMEV
jgi:hypothetical protein